jgi:simple sugar transport system ATP-binding protein
MTTEQTVPAAPRPAQSDVPVLEARSISKVFGRVIAIKDVSLSVKAGEVNCLLGDNGAGKSTLIKTLSGVHRPDEGQLFMDGEPVTLASPRDAQARGIATVFQDLAVLPLMSISRNFFLGNEPTKGIGPLRRFDMGYADQTSREKMREIGIVVRDTAQLVGTLSGGERQTLAIARAEYFGARVLILDEPTSALGVKQAAIVLRHIVKARARGLAVIFITHNVQHALPVGDKFTILSHGRSEGVFKRGEVTLDQLLSLMGGGAELSDLSRELEQLQRDITISQASEPGPGAGAEHQVLAVGRLEARRIHAARRDLHRVDDVDADVDQVRDEVEDRAAAVVEEPGRGLRPDGIEQALLARLDEADVGLGADHPAELRRDVVPVLVDVEELADLVEVAGGGLDRELGDAIEEALGQRPVGRHRHHELLGPDGEAALLEDPHPDDAGAHERSVRRLVESDGLLANDGEDLG